MRCLSCNALLSDYEATRKSASTNEFLDLCNHCYYTISDDVASLYRTDLAHEEDDMFADHDSLDDVDFELDNDHQ
jgi:hypothetical protein